LLKNSKFKSLSSSIIILWRITQAAERLGSMAAHSGGGAEISWCGCEISVSPTPHTVWRSPRFGHRNWVLMTHKYRGSQQSSREEKRKFIDSTQGEPKNIYKP
jgi:hypothetical protein